MGGLPQYMSSYVLRFSISSCLCSFGRSLFVFLFLFFFWVKISLVCISWTCTCVLPHAMIYFYIDISHVETIGIITGYNLWTKHTRGDSGKVWLKLSHWFQRRFFLKARCRRHTPSEDKRMTFRIRKAKIFPAHTNINKKMKK